MADSADLLTVKNVSYLRARDPSILAFNRPGLAEVRTNLIRDLDQETVLNEPKQNDNICVYLRIKNGYDFRNLYQICDNTLVCNVPPSAHCMRNFKEGDSLKKLYTFSKIFPQETTQTEIFNAVVKPKILDFINGQNSTLLTYGASGSGKTFTVIGTDEEPGLVPRSLEYLFRTLPQPSTSPRAKPMPAGNVTVLNDSDYKKEQQVRKNLLNSSSSVDRNQHVRTYTAMQKRLSDEPVAFLEDSPDVSLAIWVSFAEIYNEQIYDLLQPDPPRGKQRTRLRLGCSNGHTYIKNLSNVSVTSGLEAFQILQYGIHNLNYAATSLNSHSSRSHSIFTVKLVQVSHSDGGIYVCALNFCDLAGSERSKKTMNVGDRLKESNNINSSLLVLGRCISAVRDSQRQNDNKLVPFRESKLTQLFQKALAGHEDIAMIVTISPKEEMFDETQHVLTFSAVAKEISIETKPAPKAKKSRFSQLAHERKRKADSSLVLEEAREQEEDVEQLRNAVLFLQEQLEQERSEFELSEKLNRDYLVEGYERMLEDAQKNADRRVADTEAYLKLQFDIKLNSVKARYEKLLAEKSEREVVIRVDDSDSSGDEGGEEQQRSRMVEELKEEVGRLERTVAQFQMEAGMRDQKLRKLAEENLELRRTIEEGLEDFNRLEVEKTAMEEECMGWKRKYAEMEMLRLEINNDLPKMEDQCLENEDEERDDVDDLTFNKENATQNVTFCNETPHQKSNLSGLICSKKKLY